ncbi:DUF5701 family protein [Hoyosella altamirensis]|uniref:Uncharacterized protein n=1 Tax=Hoyosella altamirensis TaxID=616997 RepID=A0A839RT11_9ACTN|nr:DUF5701 family protein [Hoyosella altamirensis]MBB3039499.1 hypothetical protein [Hoyosella altamirensis]
MTTAELTKEAAEAEVNRQIDNLRLALTAAGRSDEVLAETEDLRDALIRETTGSALPEPARVPFALVLHRSVLPVSEVVPSLRFGSRPGFISADTADIDTFTAITDLDIPDTHLYAVIDIDRGGATRNWTPDEAMSKFANEDRSPLTVEEGAAFLLHYPESLEKNNCIQTPGSRCGDRRVPGIWISNRAPKLGFCWAGNRHTWLGIASCASRI